jgi:3'-phosphoadenosine 5'-phosphosulfate (PAPS) 3'-phosphatase
LRPHTRNRTTPLVSSSSSKPPANLRASIVNASTPWSRAGYVEKIWDHAAGKLVAEEAGVTVTDIFGRALDFSKGATLSANEGVVCAAPAVHGRIVEAIDALGITE